MSHSKNDDGDHVFTCDNCMDEVDFSGEFGEAWAEAKDEGWVAFRGEDGWEHRCPVCKGVGWR